MSIIRSTQTLPIRTVITNSRPSPIRVVLWEQLGVDGHNVVSDDCDHGESSEAISQSV